MKINNYSLLVGPFVRLFNISDQGKDEGETLGVTRTEFMSWRLCQTIIRQLTKNYLKLKQ